MKILSKPPSKDSLYSLLDLTWFLVAMDNIPLRGMSTFELAAHSAWELIAVVMMVVTWRWRIRERKEAQ